MEHDLHDIIAYHLRKHGKVLEAKLGMMEDDLLNDVREQLWKGLLSFNENGEAKLTTFLIFILNNRFKTLTRRSGLLKYNCVSYFADVYTSGVADHSDMITEETGEAIYEARQQLAVYLTLLTEVDKEIYSFLLQGYSLNEMVAKHNQINPRTPVSRISVTAAINRVQDTVNRQRKTG